MSVGLFESLGEKNFPQQNAMFANLRLIIPGFILIKRVMAGSIKVPKLYGQVLLKVKIYDSTMKAPKPEQSKLALAMTLGGVMSSNIIGGIIVGYVMDKWLGTSPWLIIAGITLGTIGAMAGLYRITSRLNEQ